MWASNIQKPNVTREANRWGALVFLPLICALILFVLWLARHKDKER